MSYILLTLLFILSGFFMKYSDDLFDVNNDLAFATICGVLCAVASAVATIYDIDAAYIFISILIGNFLAFKVDGIHHIVTMIVFLLAVLIAGFPQLNIIVLLVCILAALSDEVGHDLISNVTKNRFLNLFFEYRFVMKVVILILAICGIFNIWIFVCFISFEIAYLIAEIIFEKLN